MSLKKQAISGMSWTLLQQFGTMGIGFVVSIVLARLIEPEEFGVIGLLVIFNAIGNSLSDSGMGQSIIRGDNLEEDDYGTIFLTNLVISLLLYLVIGLCGPFIARFYDKPILSEIIWVYSFSIILTAFSSIQMTRLTKQLDFKKQAFIQLPALIISGVIGIALALLDYGVWALVWMQFSQGLILSLQYWFLTGWRPAWVFNSKKFKQHFDFGYKLTLSGLLNTIASNIFPMVIGKYFSITQVGYFNRAQTMKNLPVNGLSSALNKVTYPLFAEAKHDDEKLKRAYKKIQSIILFILAPVMFLLIIIAHPLFDLLLGSKWLPAVPYFQLLCITGIFYPIHAYNLNILKVKGRSDLFLKAEIIKKIIFAVAVLITYNWSIIAIIVAIVINNFISLIINLYFSGRFINYSLSEQIIDTIISILPSFILFILFFALNNYFQIIQKLNDIIAMLLITFLYLKLYIAYNFITKNKIFLELLDTINNLPIKRKISKTI